MPTPRDGERSSDQFIPIYSNQKCCKQDRAAGQVGAQANIGDASFR